MKILEVYRCVRDVQHYTMEISSRKPKYMIHSFVNGEYSAIQMAYKNF